MDSRTPTTLQNTNTSALSFMGGSLPVACALALAVLQGMAPAPANALPNTPQFQSPQQQTAFELAQQTAFDSVSQMIVAHHMVQHEQDLKTTTEQKAAFATQAEQIQGWIQQFVEADPTLLEMFDAGENSLWDIAGAYEQQTLMDLFEELARPLTVDDVMALVFNIETINTELKTMELTGEQETELAEQLDMLHVQLESVVQQNPSLTTATNGRMYTVTQYIEQTFAANNGVQTLWSTLVDQYSESNVVGMPDTSDQANTTQEKQRKAS